MKRLLPALALLPLACARPAATSAASTSSASDPVAPMTRPSPFWLRLDPDHAQAAPGGTCVFRPELNYRPGRAYIRPPVHWQVQEGAAGGAVDQMGHYTAPQAPGTYHVVAERTDEPGIRAVATVTVK
ncbi:MAG TPA: hypothetical protein VFT46_05345 [Holophagaceae bacterium]|nr:hypothetical protein [Holophagaceae bacterium]